jgi:hypothetical protein
MSAPFHLHVAKAGTPPAIRPAQSRCRWLPMEPGAGRNWRRLSPPQMRAAAHNVARKTRESLGKHPPAFLQISR